MSAHQYILEIYPPGDRKTCDAAIHSDQSFMELSHGDLIYLPESDTTAVIEQMLRIVHQSEKTDEVIDKTCVYTRA